MSTVPDRFDLYGLLPAHIRMRDQATGGPLRALLGVITEQARIVEDDIEQLYENWFIETCQDWVIPYIAELIGYTPGDPADRSPDSGPRPGSIPRREVANAIGYRRRKGTLALLESLAADVAGWRAHAAELFPRLAVTQHLDALQPGRGRTVDLRRGDLIDLLGSPFDDLAHTMDVRRPNSRRTPGLHSLTGLGLFAWRLNAYPITRAPAFCVDRQSHQYLFSVLGNDARLFEGPEGPHAPPAGGATSAIALPIRRRDFDRRTADYYGEGKSLCIWRDDPATPVPLDDIVPADLSRWSYRPRGSQVAVDPVLGRIAFAPRGQPTRGVWVSYHEAFGAEIGAGEYERPLETPAGARVYRVASVPPATGDYNRISLALDAWRAELPEYGIVEIADSGDYVEPIELRVPPGRTLELRAASGSRPTIRLLDWSTNRRDALGIVGVETDADPGGPGRVVLDGLLIVGRSVQVAGPLRDLAIRNCTLVPGWSLRPDCEPEYEAEPSLELNETSARVVIVRSIVGSIDVTADVVATDPLPLTITDSIIDATRPEYQAIGAPGCPVAHVVLRIARCTVLGAVDVHAIDLAENGIFASRVRVGRRQRGCMRFCYVSPGSRTPRRYRCQPDDAAAGLTGEARARAERRVQPEFRSVRYGTPTYCQLDAACPEEIRRGADDESEMGVLHDQFTPRREANLGARLDEFSPAGMDAAVLLQPGD
jgi:hypothetical protein